MCDTFEHEALDSPPRTIDAHAQEFGEIVFANLTGLESRKFLKTERCTLNEQVSTLASIFNYVKRNY